MNRDYYAEAEAIADALVREGFPSDAQALRDALLAGATSSEILGGIRYVLRRFDRANKTANLVTKRQIRSLLDGLNEVLRGMPEGEMVYFRLERDADGFPPADEESLLGTRLDDAHYRLESAPIFVRGVASGDVVQVRDVEGRLWFQRVTERGGHRTIRVSMLDTSLADGVKQVVRGFGCDLEKSQIAGYFSIDVPPDANKTELLAFLREQRAAQTLDYEEGPSR
jgi:hypothetical protein